MIPKSPVHGQLEGYVKGEVGNYESKRVGAMLNLPVGETFAIRAAGSMTKRSGYDYNSFNKTDVNDRDLWSTRVSALWSPSEKLNFSMIWERFEEDDRRSRTGKQLCTTDPGPESVLGYDLGSLPMTRGVLSQTCLSKSLYKPEAYGVPNGLSLPHIIAAQGLSLGRIRAGLGNIPFITLLPIATDPYEGVVQSTNRREIATQLDPRFRASNDFFNFNVNLDVSDSLKFASQTSYTEDRYNSTQDYNRFVSNEVFGDSSGLFTGFFRNPTDGITPDGVFTDPQLGKSKRIVGMDMVKSKSDQWYQEFRFYSDNDSPLNFNIGLNYTEFKIKEDYYVFNNLFTALSHLVFGIWGTGQEIGNCDDFPGVVNCAYVDYNEIDNISGDGHNYFRSINVNKTRSLGLFGELYYDLPGDVKVTAGLRYTKDKKTAQMYKSQLLLAPGLIGGGYVGKGFRRSPDIVQDWGRLTGRLVVDWKPHFAFSDDALIYASYSRGYKGGGSNPPGIDANPETLTIFDNPLTFQPESVNAVEVGIKGSAVGRKLQFSANAFLYDYTGYQVSQIVDRLALNENYDALMWGAELELAYNITPRLRMSTNVGYLGSKIAKGEKSIDVMNRTQGNANWTVVRPWLQLASNCIAPTEIVHRILTDTQNPYNDTYATSVLTTLCGGSYMGNFLEDGYFEGLYGFSYDPAVDAPNQGRGFFADLGGNEMPNAPKWTFNIAGSYKVPVGDWSLGLHADYYMQSASWARVYNTSIDRIESWSNVNSKVTLENSRSGIEFQLYVKNIFNKSSITDVFINSDDSGLTANIFTVDPRIIGFGFNKKF
jgi:outer membrane receptor protein involved in Fe transport